MDEGEIRDPEWFKYFDDDSPWDEFKWESFMQADDEIACRFLGKFTKSIDLPDCEEFIERELNGDYGEDDAFECPHNGMDCKECPDREECDPFGELDESADEEEIIMPADFRKDPIWKKAYNIALRLQHLADSKNGNGAERDPLFELLLNSRMITAKIAGAFGIGFHLDGLGGNIVNHKKALSSTLKCLDAISELEKTKGLTANRRARYRRVFLDLRERLMSRIHELRHLFHKMREES